MKFGLLPTRFSIAVMLFTACWVNYMMRVNMSVNIIAMVPANNGSSAQSQCVKKGADTSQLNDTSSASLFFGHLIRKFDEENILTWTAKEQGLVLSAYFYGYSVTSAVGGVVAERWGPRLVVFLTMLGGSLLTVLSPWLARMDYQYLAFARFLTGSLGGFLFPGLHALVAHWAPPTEKGKFVSSLLGGACGTVVTWSISGPLLQNWGWAVTFYIEGAIGIVWCTMWWYLVHDSPTLHPRITESEKKYILLAIGDKVVSTKGEKLKPPFKKIFTSFYFLSMVVLHYGSNWGLYFIMTAAPKYVSSVLGFNLASTGTLASLPYLARLIFSVIFGAIGDRLVKMNVVSTTCIRKFFCIFSHIVPGLLLICMGYTGCSPILSIALMSFSMGSNGAATLTNLVNHQDLAPNFAGTLYGIANGIGNTAGFLTPLVTAHFTKDGNGFAEWQPVFMTGGTVYIATALYFILFGTGVTQQWNYVSANDKEDREHEDSGNSTDTKVAIPAN